jgi:hypothetical protein
MAVPYKLNYFEIESGLGTTSTFLHKGDLTANRIIKIGGTSNDILLGDGSTGSLSGKQNTITLTTSGTSGAATLIGATLNIPNYSPDLTGYVTLGTTQTITGAKTFGATITSNRINATATGSGAAVISALAFDNAVAGSFSNTTTFLQNNPTLFVQQGGDGRIALFQSGTANVVIESDGDINGIKDLTLTSAIKKSTIGATYTYDLPNANGTIALVGGAGVGTVTSVAALTLGTTGTDLSSTVANGTTTPVITLNVPTASATNRGALSSADWSVFNGKQAAGNYITSLTGEATASGPGAASVTLDNTAVIGKVLTGLNVTGGTVASTDSILTALGKVQNQINGLIGGSIYQGTWNATTNTPALASSVGTNGYYYIVNVAGSTNLNGITDWQVGDWAIFNGGVWQKVDNTDAVITVNGYSGIVSLVTGDVLEGAGSLPGRPSQLYFTDARARAAISLTTTGSSGAATYDNGTGVLNIPNYGSALTGYVTLDTAQTITAAKTFSTSGGSDTLIINHSSGSGIALNITKGGNGEGIYVNKTSGTGNAVTIIGTLNATTLVKSGGTSSQFLKADGSVDSTSYGTGSVTSVAAITLGTSGFDLSSTVANGTTTPVITLNVPTASSIARGVLSSADWTTFNNKQPAGSYVTTNTVQSITGNKTFSGSTLRVDVVGTSAISSFTNNSTSWSYSPSLNSVGFNNSNNFYIANVNGNGGIFTFSNPATVVSYAFPATSGTIALTSNLSAYLPLSGGTLTGALGGTSATFSGAVQSTSFNGVDNISLVAQNINTNGTVLTLNSAGTVGTIKLQTNSTDRLTLTSSGNLGLGVTPSAWDAGWLGGNTNSLEIGQLGSTVSAGAGGLVIGNNIIFNSGAYKYARTFPATYYIQNTSAGQHQWFTAPSGTAGNAISFTQAMTLDASGNLGIGTTSPTSLLELKQSNLPRITLLKTGVLSWYVGNPTQGTSNNFSIGTDSGGNTEILTLTNTGNVGIGTTSPGAKLEVVSSGGSQLLIGFAGNSQNYYDANTHYFRGTFGGAGGNVLIGTTTDNGAKLQVNGGVFINGVTSNVLISHGEKFIPLSGPNSVHSFDVATEFPSLAISGNVLGVTMFLTIFGSGGSVYSAIATIARNSGGTWSAYGLTAITSTASLLSSITGSGTTITINTSAGSYVGVKVTAITQ